MNTHKKWVSAYMKEVVCHAEEYLTCVTIQPTLPFACVYEVVWQLWIHRRQSETAAASSSFVTRPI
jgi:hypothetical protein